MSDEYTQEFRDEVLDWTEIASMAGVFAAVAAHDERIRAETVRVTAEKAAGAARDHIYESRRTDYGDALIEGLGISTAKHVRATFGLAPDEKGGA